MYQMINLDLINIQTAVHNEDKNASMDIKYEGRKFKNLLKS